MNTPLDILQQYWNYSQFRSHQLSIIESVLSKQHTLAILPTGGGKSICYQIPPLVSQQPCIVISPLIALMKDQVASLQKKGIKAMLIPSNYNQDELITLFDNFKYANYAFLYISPERLQSSFIQEKIKELSIGFVAIDEAHCISEWGHDFRPSYRNIQLLRNLCPGSTFIAVTATATPKVMEDIATNLQFENPKVFIDSFQRPNLAYQVFEVEDKFSRLTRMIAKLNTSCIVYVSSRKKAEDVAQTLLNTGYKATYYHGGMNPEERTKSYELWASNQIMTMVATNAFGMGIDKADVGLVVHLDIPSSIENYMQEAGRAGRDHSKAFAVLLYTANDSKRVAERFEKNTPSFSEIKEIHKKLYQYTGIAFGELLDSSFRFSLQDFCNRYQFSSAKVSFTLTLLVNHGVVQITPHYNDSSTIHIVSSPKTILNTQNNKSFTKNLMDVLLRSYTGLFDQETAINEFFIASRLGTTSRQVIQKLQQLDQEGVLVYTPSTKESKITFLLPREDDRTLHRFSKTIKAYIAGKKEKVTQILQYIDNNTQCRSKQLLTYFGESKSKPCGLCDVCIEGKTHTKDLKKVLLELLAKNQMMTSQEICSSCEASERDILILLRELLAEEVIALNLNHQYYIL